MNFTRALIAGLCLSASALANAAPVTLGSLERNADSTVITDTATGLQWLQWSETVGMSSDEALENYSAEGWRLAKWDEMNGLFSPFGFAFDRTVNDTKHTIPFTLEDSADEFAIAFADVFGRTRDGTSSEVESTHAERVTSAIYDHDGLIGYAVAHDDFKIPNWNSNSEKDQWIGMGTSGSSQYPFSGVALVRSEVSTPGSLALFGLAGLILAARRRK